MSSKLFRSPVVVVLGHVDHGKTTLLDSIRKTNVAEHEAGLITQSIGAYEVDCGIKGYSNSTITFIDTPGHEAFSVLRQRGASVADIAVLIVDATDSVKPQTIESIYHIQSGKIPFIVAINKIDLPTANVDKVKKDLTKHNVIVEGLGGQIPAVPISAKKGTGISDLLEAILFTASEQKLTYDSGNPLEAYIIEANITKAGVSASIIIKDGQLSVGEEVFAGTMRAKIRSLIDQKGKQISKVVPSSPFVLLGFKELPQTGCALVKELQKEEKVSDVLSSKTQKTPEDFFASETGKKLKVIVKAESSGSLEALVAALSKFTNIEIECTGVGQVTKSDIFMARCAKAIIMNFAQPVGGDVVDSAKQEKVLIKTYDIIYELLDEVEEVARLLEEKEKIVRQLVGEAKVVATFRIEDQVVAGIQVVSGKIRQDDPVDYIREGNIVAQAKVASLKQKAKTAREVKKNEEAGVILEPELDFRVGDVIKSYSI